jgi:energy-coupling factor transporter ATP-binding protein EcfA2
MSDIQIAIGQGPSFPIGVTTMEVEGLHGKFDYNVDLVAPAQDVDRARVGQLLAVSEDRLTLLYGRNGSGKTSLLRLLFHAIASSGGRGHRTEISRTQFRRFSVTLTDGSLISYARDEGQTVGPCTALISRPGGEPVRWQIKPNKEGAVKAVDQQLVMLDEPDEVGIYRSVSETEQFLRALAGLRLNPIFLGDYRGIVGDMIDRDRNRDKVLARVQGNRHGEELRRVVELEEAIELVRDYLSRVAFAGTQAGASKVDTVYLNVARAIIEHPDEGEGGADLIPELIDRVLYVGQQVELLHSYGLMPELPYERLISLLKRATEPKAELLQQVLGPYLEGLEERAGALGPGLLAVSAYIDALNSFLQRKTAEFHLGRPQGIVIRDDDTGQILTPGELSSGEKQIVLLFSDVIALQEETRLFIIDEPELSLNPEWQRQLMPHLLGVTERSRMQLLAATHSIEILAQYRGRIRNLEA